MKTVWKFELPVQDDVTVSMPQGAIVLDVQSAHAGMLTLWAIVHPDEPTEDRAFHVRGTGHPLGEVGQYVATVSDGPFVWHVFEAAVVDLDNPPEGYRYVQRMSDKEPRLVKETR